MSRYPSQVTLARTYLAIQAAACVLWWVAVFASDTVRVWTLGGWDPRVLAVPDLVLFAGLSALAAARRSWRVAAVMTGWSAVLTAGLLWQGLVERAAGWGVVLMTAATLGSVAATLTLRSGRMPTAWFFVGPFRFAAAPAAGPGRHLVASVLQLAVFWVSFFLVMPWLLVALEERLRVSWEVLEGGGWHWGGIVLFLLASPWGLWSCLTMARVGQGTPLPARTARRLVVAGPYRWVRNPMATAGVVQSIGVGLWFGRWTMIAAALAGAIAWHIGIRPVEEADLLARFGAPYETYRTQVRCWVPLMR